MKLGRFIDILMKYDMSSEVVLDIEELTDYIPDVSAKSLNGKVAICASLKDMIEQ